MRAAPRRLAPQLLVYGPKKLYKCLQSVCIARPSDVWRVGEAGLAKLQKCPQFILHRAFGVQTLALWNSNSRRARELAFVRAHEWLPCLRARARARLRLVCLRARAGMCVRASVIARVNRCNNNVMIM